MVEITILRTYAPTNIGNLFIDLGSAHSLKSAMPESNIHHVSGLPKILFEYRYSRRKTLNRVLASTFGRLFNLTFGEIVDKKKFFDIKSEMEDLVLRSDAVMRNCFDLAPYIKSDYAVISGCVLNGASIRRFSRTLFDLKRKGVKILFNGVSGSSYSEREIYAVRKFLKKIKPYAFISRDEVAFENYHDSACFSFNGVDCGFFLNDFFSPVELNLPEYIVLTFDRLPEPKLQFKGLVVRTHHKFLGELPRRFFNKANVLISDSPFDYLNVYGNATCLFSDRVHACIAGVSLGVPCRLYHKTPRSLLFDRVGLGDVKKRVVYPRNYDLKREKERQLSFLSDVLD